ncbi:MAG: AMP-dependent synthetase [Chloroflexi bacterium HGW-Chloroflexi-9]|nr:MAG: AMP-dependent synthetase [Chloroflexi bacterium HGW-Chloroflexi-9]
MNQPATPASNPPLNLARWCLGDRAEDPARAHAPAFTFVHEDGHTDTWTAAEAWTRVQRIGRGLLARGLAPGDRVLVRLPHSPDYAFAFLGATVAGLVPIPASPALTDEEAAFLAADSEAAASITTPALRLAGATGAWVDASALDALDGDGPLPETHAEDPAFLIYTSGTTDRPKGVLHAHRTVYGRAMMREAWQGFQPGDVTLHAGTLNWSYTLGVGLMDPWAAGAHAVLAAGVSGADGWPALMERLGVTVFAAVPTVYRQMLKYGQPEAHDLSRLRHVLCAGEPLPPTLRDEWRARAGTEMYESLGMTEVSTYISSGPTIPVRAGSPGRPQPGRRVAILDADSDSTTPLPPGQVGLLAVHRSDPGLMLGYWRRPVEQAEVFRGEWFTGGDLASIDTDGYVWFHGRHDDLIKSFGYRLSPVEIEHALSGAPGVLEVAVVGLAVDTGKTLVTACVVPQPDTALDVAALQEFAAQHLAEYKRPHQYLLQSEPLPRTRNGKVLRRAIIERLTPRA